jgi:hypothetical protein
MSVVLLCGVMDIDLIWPQEVSVIHVHVSPHFFYPGRLNAANNVE